MNIIDETYHKDKQEIFARLEKVASQANLSPEERARYEEEWKRYNDYFNTLESAHIEGFCQGEYAEKLRNAQSFRDLGVDVKIISQATGLSIEEIEKL